MTQQEFKQWLRGVQDLYQMHHDVVDAKKLLELIFAKVSRMGPDDLFKRQNYGVEPTCWESPHAALGVGVIRNG